MFQVQTNIFGKVNLEWADSNARVGDLELQGHEEQYGEV